MVAWILLVPITVVAFIAAHLDERITRYVGWFFFFSSGIDGVMDLPEAIGTGHHLWLIAELGWIALAFYVTAIAFDADLRAARLRRLSGLHGRIRPYQP